MVAQYPAATWIAAANGNFTPSNRSSVDITLIVIHITDGHATMAEQTARWFANPHQTNNKGKAIHVSAHYVVGRQGEVFQCVHHEDIAHHAGQANHRSIGIEHVVPHVADHLTDDQYAASARLVAWLGGELRIPVDSGHWLNNVRGHAAVDAHTTHHTCPNRAFDWPRYWVELSATGGQDFDTLIGELARGRG